LGLVPKESPCILGFIVSRNKYMLGLRFTSIFQTHLIPPASRELGITSVNF
jgi:hypothetical protein